jgi:hypothetical protein
MEISDGAIIKYNYELCVKVVNKSNLQSKRVTLIHMTTIIIIIIIIIMSRISD